jgi:asparagine synthase (glutamine-hydrolysing)
VCGICGILRVSDGAPAIDPDEVLRVREAMAARGPDGAGAWFSPDGTVGLGHRRLAILDLSEAGLQPMASASGRYRIVFNGEVYNFLELRERLEMAGTRFATRSDTEVILALYEAEGPAGFARLRGMFALAIWDGVERSLVLARDPYGIKPLYHSLDRGTLRFASQVKALEAGGSVSRTIEPAAVVGFLLWGSVPEPWTIRKHVRALAPGHWLRAGPGGVGDPVPFGPLALERPGPAANDVAAALERSVRYHLVSDVPVAVFLSAGLDSAMIAALARRASSEPPATITLRFEEFRGTVFDEAPAAARIAASLGTRHIERTVGRRDFLGIWDRAVGAMDQPSIDGFNTYVVSRAAADLGFKVVLSGLGGDELFGSYSSFRDVPRWARWSRRLGRVPGLRPAWPIVCRLAPSKPKLAAMLESGASLAGAYGLRRGLFLPREVLALLPSELARDGFRGLGEAPPIETALRSQGAPVDALDADPWRAVHWMESVQYMKNQLLRDSDWASMAHSLELRVPLVDPYLRGEIEALGFEPAKSGGKAAVARSVAPELPAEVFLRPKTGFGIPVMGWLEPEGGAGESLGADSRRLALRILETFGIETHSSRWRSAKR